MSDGMSATGQGTDAFLQAYQQQISQLEADPNATPAYDQALQQEFAAIVSQVQGESAGSSNAASSSASSASADSPAPAAAFPTTAAPAADGPSAGTGTGADDPVGNGTASFSASPQSAAGSPEQTQQMAANLVGMLTQTYGLTQNQAVGVVSSLMEESGLNTGIEQGGSFTANPSMAGDVVNQTGYGLAQWGEDRKQGLLDYAAQNGLPPSSQAAQVGFMMQELNGPYSGVISDIKNGPDDASAACATWTGEYEEASDPNMGGRLDNIAQVQSWLAQA